MTGIPEEPAIEIALRDVPCCVGPSWLISSCRAIVFHLPRVRESPYTYPVSIATGFKSNKGLKVKSQVSIFE